IALWNEEDQFFYDVLHLPDGTEMPLRARSAVGLLPLLAVQVIEPELLAGLPAFAERMDWFLANRPGLASLVSHFQLPGMRERRLVSLVRSHRMTRLLERMLDPAEFLSDHGIRSVSRYHLDHPFTMQAQGTTYSVGYEPAESREALFGGNSNWRGPIWFPTNF